MTSRHGASVEPSARLVQVLLIYCNGLQQASMEDLRASLRAGRYPWLRDELSAAILEEGTSTWWTDAVGDASIVNGQSSRRRPRAEQRHVWRILFPGEPFLALSEPVATS
jgi:hypothetical protein